MNTKIFAASTWCVTILFGAWLVDRIWQQHLHVEGLEKQREMLSANAGSIEETIFADNSSDESLVLARLHHSISKLEQGMLDRLQAAEARLARADRSMAQNLATSELGPDQWNYSGRGSPHNVAETVLWAGAWGNLSAMETSLALDEESDIAARSLFDRLPDDLQKKYQTPERIVSIMTLSRIPLSKAKLVASVAVDWNQAELKLRFTSNIDEPSFVKLNAAKGMDANWSILVPESAIYEYAEDLGIALD